MVRNNIPRSHIRTRQSVEKQQHSYHTFSRSNDQSISVSSEKDELRWAMDPWFSSTNSFTTNSTNSDDISAPTKMLFPHQEPKSTSSPDSVVGIDPFFSQSNFHNSGSHRGSAFPHPRDKPKAIALLPSVRERRLTGQIKTPRTRNIYDSSTDTVGGSSISNTSSVASQKPPRPDKIVSPNIGLGPIIPNVFNIPLEKTLALIFSAFWEQADLYTDILSLQNDRPTRRELRVAFFREGRQVLATPIDTVDDMTTLSVGMKPTQDVSSVMSVIRAGIPVSRKAKLKFQAISLSHDIVADPVKRAEYDEWRLWHPRLPPPDDSFAKSEISFTEDDLAQVMTAPSSIMTSNNSKIQNDNRRRSVNQHTTSILRESSYNVRRNPVPKKKSIQKKISWNEEVEELRITDYFDDKEKDYESNSNTTLPHTSMNPQQENADNWFNQNEITPKTNDQHLPTNSQQVSRDNVDTKTSKEKATYTSQDDSLLTILDNSDISFEGLLGPKQEVENEIKSLLFDDNLPRNSTQTKSSGAISVNEQSSLFNTEFEANFHANMFHQNTASNQPSLLDESLTFGGSITSTVDWDLKSTGTERFENGCSIPKAVDMASGFQFHLSKYIESAVSEMKEGLSTLGKKWNELDFTKLNDGSGDYPFILHTAELDALMGILKTEIDKSPLNAFSKKDQDKTEDKNEGNPSWWW